MSRATVISVRLTREELVALRRIPGDTDGARLRSLIHARALVDAVSDEVNSTVNADGEKTRRLIIELSRRLQTFVDTNTNPR